MPENDHAKTTHTNLYDMGPYNEQCPRKPIRRLHLNEFRGRHPLAVTRALLDSFSTDTNALLTEYPSPPSCLSDIAEFLDIPSSNIIISSGSDTLLQSVLFTASTRQQKCLIMGLPTYTHFRNYAQLAGLEFHEYGLDIFPPNHVKHQYESIEYYKKQLLDGSVVYIGSPNNPVGHSWPSNLILALSRMYRKSTFIIDEAYVEFESVKLLKDGKSRQDLQTRQALNLASSAKFIIENDLDNVIVTRTFSKAFGLAGLRVGYAIACSPLLDSIRPFINPKSFTAFASPVVKTVLSNLEFYLRSIQETLDVRTELGKGLEKMGWPSIIGGGNFILVYCNDTQHVYQKFKEHNIYIRDRDSLPGLDGFIRLTVGSYDDYPHILGVFKLLDPPSLPPIQVYYTRKSKITKLKTLLRQAMEIFKDNGIAVWLESGSLLGWLRHKSYWKIEDKTGNFLYKGGIIPVDNDIDLGYLLSEEDQMVCLIDRFKKSGMSLQRNRTKAYWQIGDNPPGTVISDEHIDIFPFIHDRHASAYICADPRFSSADPGQTKCNPHYLIYGSSGNELQPLYGPVMFYDIEIHIPASAVKSVERALGPKCLSTIRLDTAHMEFAQAPDILKMYSNIHKPSACIEFPLKNSSPA